VQALILAGGEGTRLRPLTSGVPKPVVPLVDRPFIAFMLEWLRSHGVDDVVMSCGFLASGVRDVLGEGEEFGMRIRYVEEPTPMGTGGALKFAEALLDERFLMLNGDVLTDIDLTAQIAQHEATGAACTLALVAVEDPSNYGLVRMSDDDTTVLEFLEKPSADTVTDVVTVSAGAYVLERSVLDLLSPDQPASIERDVFPRLVGNGLHAIVGEGYWLDIGTPERYLQGTFDILEGTVVSEVLDRLGEHSMVVADDVENEGRIVPASIIESGCRIGHGAHVGGRVMLQRNVTIGENSRVERAVVLEGTRIGANCTVSGCIIGANVTIGDHTRVEGLSVIGEGVSLGAENVITNGVRLFPGVTIPDGGMKF
jgi:mannose-1-phosphate guanylyltransferase